MGESCWFVYSGCLVLALALGINSLAKSKSSGKLILAIVPSPAVLVCICVCMRMCVCRCKTPLVPGTRLCQNMRASLMPKPLVKLCRRVPWKPLETCLKQLAVDMVWMRADDGNACLTKNR